MIIAMIKDPGKNKRKQAWKRPLNKADRDKLRNERIAAMKGVHQVENSYSISDKSTRRPDL